MSNTGDLPELEPLTEPEALPKQDAVPELEPLEESAMDPAPAAPAPAAGASAMPVSMAGMPAPAFGMRAQKEYYRFLFAGVLMFLGCMMPFGPELDQAGYKSLGGACFTVISLGIVWSSWIAITHGRFDLSTMRWLTLAVIPLWSTVWHLVKIFDEPAVKAYIAQTKAAHAVSTSGNKLIVVDSWAKFGEYLAHFKTPEYSEQVDNFLRAYGSGKIVLMIGSLLAVVYFLMGVMSGMKAGKAQKAAAESARAARKPGGRRR